MDWFIRVGTEVSTGTKIFLVTGDVPNTGLVEIPMGTTIDQLVHEIGGANENTVKAVQTGGPSGGCIPKAKFSLPIDFDSLEKAESIMGSGGMIVLDDSSCMVEVARYFISLTQEESCGKCPPCRIGTKRMLEILTRVIEGKATSEDINMLSRLSSYIKDSALCGLGKTAPNPVLSTLRYFREEYEMHLNSQCPAGVCFSRKDSTKQPVNSALQGKELHSCFPLLHRITRLN